ncbi:MAG TPA: FHA domain-containing protein [Ktedonobacterales bacterium]
MEAADFPAWFSASLYGGLACAALAALVIACWSLALRRGLSSQVVVGLLACLIASVLDVAPIVWSQSRLGVYGPALGVTEVMAALVFTALFGWVTPLGAMIWYLLYAAPLGSTVARLTRGRSGPALDVDQPGRAQLVNDDGHAWGWLTQEHGDTLAGAIALRNAVILVGRDPACDLSVSDERVSRYHATLRWEKGSVWLEDLSSLNGTRVNTLVVAGRTPLQDNDVIQFGDHAYRFMTVAPLALASSASSTMAETRKTAGVSGSFGAGGRTLALVWNDMGATRQWALSAPITTIGRDAASMIVIPDDSVSRRHAQITRQPSGYFIVDIESSNGLLHNGKPVEEPQRLHVGDTIQMGDARLVVVDAEPDDTATITVRKPAIQDPQIAGENDVAVSQQNDPSSEG